jgi:hypothetical protein
MAQMLPNLESQIRKFASFQDAFGKQKIEVQMFKLNN